MTNDTEKTTSSVPALTAEELEKIDSLSYEQARDQLIQAVQALEAGGLDLDASMRQWQIGEALAKRAQKLLDDVRSRLDAAQAEQASAGATAGTQGNLS
ncbi:exodeoxyribonuclease VII small subunit [Bifidobacterium catulorum]|uniref:Exodeoxyribonuclease 7 small subunit n=1 Tax=Bifidobacterium catulorum TaxID=1630173 RepID=A0A2U2MQ14_9BIFI|nr:exodeoxyribonuclease VII small subunit [Bifidobacterium catulorum]PWG58937.1 exodeoxyribonuclease VII small subunit [Bifidobacterium catulorum]